MALTSMKNEPEKRESMLAECSVDCDELYPYGLRIYINEKQMAKLGIATMPEIGSTLMLTAMVEVVGLSENKSQDDGKIEERKSMDMQITDMELTSGNPAEGSIASKLYSA